VSLKVSKNIRQKKNIGQNELFLLAGSFSSWKCRHRFLPRLMTTVYSTVLVSRRQQADALAPMTAEFQSYRGRDNRTEVSSVKNEKKKKKEKRKKSFAINSKKK
jgi:hypothetical protein